MTSQEIIQKALVQIDFNNQPDFKKLLENGLRFKGVDSNGDLMFMSEYGPSSHAYETLIFCNWFGKAFWGEENIPTGYFRMVEYTLIDTNRPVWEYHQQRMAIADNKLKYLAKGLK